MKRLLFFILVLLWAGSSSGVTVQVGSGIATTPNYPLTAYYGYSYTQQIYTQAQIATTGTITKLRFYLQSGAVTNSSAWVIYLGHTTKTTFATTTDWVPLASLTEVFNGTVTFPAVGNWMEITLTTPFAYNNANNLVVAVDENTPSYSAANVYWYSFTSGTNTGIYYRNDATNPNPATPPTASGRTAAINQIQFEMTVTTPDLTVEPGSLAFGYVAYGSSSESNYILAGTNLTAGPIVITAPASFDLSLTPGGPYSNPLNATYTPPTLGNTTIYVRFTPAADLTLYSGNITHVGGGAAKNVAVSGSSDLFALYCTSGASSSGDEEITNVTFGDNLNNTSACASLTGTQGTATGTADLYSNFFFSVPATNVNQGISVPISVGITLCAGSPYSHSVRAYIDFNQNGLLTDAGEEFILWAYAISNTHTITSTIAVPVTAKLGNTLMRIVCRESSTIGPCLVSSYGETEDYKINIIPLPTCFAPTSLTTTDITSTTAVLDWTNGASESLWDVIYGPPGFNPSIEGTLISGIDAHPYTLNPPLSSASSYTWYVRSDCGEGDISFWSAPANFATLCEEYTIPFSESFDGTAFPPVCWLSQKIGGPSNPGTFDRQIAGTFPTCAPHSGVGMTRYNSFTYNDGTSGILVTPAFILPSPSQTYGVKFWMYRDGGYATSADRINVHLNDVPGLDGAALLGTVNRSSSLEPVVAENGWYEYSFLFPSGQSGTGRYVIIEGVSDYGNNIFMDDFEIIQVSSLEGYVYDYNHNPLAGALIEKVGGITAISGPDGYYLLSPVSAGLQQFMCSKTGYNDFVLDIDIPAATLVTQDFTLTNPMMALTPGAFFDVLLPSEMSTTSFNITNDGNGPLGWEANINYTGTPALFAGADGQQGSEYTPGENSTIDKGNGEPMTRGGNRADLMSCPVGSLFSIAPVGSYTGYTSTSSSGYKVYQAFTGVNGYINQVTFWGLYTAAPGTPTFTIDLCLPGQTPGAIVSTLTIPIESNITGVQVLGYDVYMFTIAFPQVSLGAGWVGIEQLTDTPVFYWLNSLEGAGLPAYQAGAGFLPERVALCLGGIGGWITMDNINGIVSPFGANTSNPIHFDASKANYGAPGVPGESYTADLLVSSDPDVGTITVPVTLAIADESLAPPSDLTLFVADNSEGIFLLKWQFVPSKATANFIIIRNGQVVGNTTTNSFTDDVDVPGEYCYKVSRVYSDGNISVPAGPLCINWPVAPGVPVANWALLLGGLLMASFVFIRFAKRS